MITDTIKLVTSTVTITMNTAKLPPALLLGTISTTTSVFIILVSTTVIVSLHNHSLALSSAGANYSRKNDSAQFAAGICCTDQHGRTFYPLLLKKQGSDTDKVQDGYSKSFKDTLVLSKNLLFLRSMAPADVTDTPHETRGSSDYDLSRCISGNSSLNLTVENEITIYHICLKDAVNYQGGAENGSVSPNSRHKRGSSQSQHRDRQLPLEPDETSVMAARRTNYRQAVGNSEGYVPHYSVPGIVRTETLSTAVRPETPKTKQAVYSGTKLSSSPSQQRHKAPDSPAGLCSLFIKAPPGKVLLILVQYQTCSRDNQVRVDDIHDGGSTTLNGCLPWMPPGYDVTTVNSSAVLVVDLHNLVDVFDLKVHIKAVAGRTADEFITRYVSPVLGYIQTPGWHPFTRPFTGTTRGTAAVLVPSKRDAVISVVYMSFVKTLTYVELLKMVPGSENPQKVWRMGGTSSTYPDAERLTNLTEFRVKFIDVLGNFFGGARLLFSLHQPVRLPQLHGDGLWNCSVPAWPDFRQHFVCNNRTECTGLEDEMGCPDTSCQQGGVQLDDRCYFSLRLPEERATFQQARAACRLRGAALASFQTVRSWYHLALLRSRVIEKQELYYLGLQSAGAKSGHIVLCPDRHVTHEFLACDAFSACCHGRDVKPPSDANVTTDSDASPDCVSVGLTSFQASFPCGNGATSVPYSLVCDHRRDCADNSDEDFCVFPQCSSGWQFKCFNGQCLPVSHHCDEIVQCLDESDEAGCKLTEISGKVILLLPPPLRVDFNGRGCMTYIPLLTKERVQEIMTLCPETHVLCLGNDYCLPVYVRCNGQYDCPDHEDEVGCDGYTCPGLYRCRGLSNICLHPDHLCDGWPQCPQHDDELFCNLTCPDSCTCLGHAFTCTGDFHVELFTRLRYLDAGGTGLKPDRLSNSSMLVYLSLANCDLTNLGSLNLPHLRSLDLSDNRLNVIPVDELKVMTKLQNLSLARNPLLKALSNSSDGDSRAFLMNEFILRIDLSGVQLNELHVPSLLPFPRLLSLNLSGSDVTRLLGDGFRSLTSLRTLDLRGCPMTVIPGRVFKGLKDLRLVLADNYKLCCEANLPEGFNAGSCLAPFNEISSCDALLRSDIYRVCLSVLASLALSGNLGCFCLRVFSLTGRSKTGFTVFVTHLCVADFVMGVYMAVIGVTDRLYLGRYLWEEDRWRHSAACRVAGVLALLSSEVSALIICLITLDRFLVIRFPFSRLRFSQFSAQAASLVTWTACVVLVTVPLLPVTSYWNFYGQTGICIPLPVTRIDFAGHHYAFGVMILLNLVVFLLIATGQISVYLSMTSNAMSSIDTTRKSRDLIVARRLITVVASDFLCWFPLGLLGVLAARGVPIPGEVNVAMAIFVLPLNSALNPFLYTLNMIQEKRRRVSEEKLLKLIRDQGFKERQGVDDE